MSFIVTELEQPLWRITRHIFAYPEHKRSPAEVALAAEDFRKVAEAFEQRLQPHLVDNHFTVADIAATYTLGWAAMPMMTKAAGDLLGGTPRLVAYMEKHRARPGFPVEAFG